MTFEQALEDLKQDRREWLSNWAYRAGELADAFLRGEISIDEYHELSRDLAREDVVTRLAADIVNKARAVQVLIGLRSIIGAI